MKEKIKNYMDYLGLTAAQIADQIGVQRSSFSHILNGRNKPSADFVSKLLQVYPDLNANWLFGSSDKMVLSQRAKSGARDLFSLDTPDGQVELVRQSSPKAEYRTEKHENVSSGNESIIPGGAVTQDNEIEKIIILYNDRSFKEYKPG